MTKFTVQKMKRKKKMQTQPENESGSLLSTVYDNSTLKWNAFIIYTKLKPL